MKFVVTYQLYAWEADEVVFNTLTSARNYFFDKAQEAGIRRVILSVCEEGRVHDIMECDKALWTIAVQFEDKGADVHWYRTESYEYADEYFKLCQKDKTVTRIKMYLENTKEKVLQAIWERIN